MIDLAEARTVAVEAAEAAGALLTARVRGLYGIQLKGVDGDLVTDLDHQAEKIILDRLRAAYPDHAVLAEESGADGGGDLLWVVDPLDGTNNLAIGLPAYSVGIALCARGDPVVGVVHDPVKGQTWSAIRGRGADGPDGRLGPLPGQPRTRPVLSWLQGYGVSRTDPAALAYKFLLGIRAQRLLQLWAPQLAWVMLARGTIDGIVGYRTGVIDLPAGALLAAEAGVEFRTLDGGPFELRVNGDGERSFLAARPDALGALVELAGAAARLELPVIP